MSRKSKNRPRKVEQPGKVNQPTLPSRESYGASKAQASTSHEVYISDQAWLWLSLAVLVVACVVRLYALELKPVHHDEGVNGHFLTTLFRSGAYRYDPSNYHGPVLYYLTLPLVALFGLETWAIRLLTVIFGVGTVVLFLLLHRRIGRLGALAAAALLAVSPGAVFFSRYYIHETLFVFFTLAAVVAWLRFTETARPLYFMLTSASVALLFATKETAFISVGVLLIAAAFTHFYMRLWDKAKGGRRGASSSALFSSDLNRFGEKSSFVPLLVGGAAVFVAINVLFYSSFFTNSDGIADAIEAYALWRRTGESDFHAKSFFAYFGWLWKEEAALFVLGSIGALWALWRARNRFIVFAALWAGGIILAYSLIPYKTPWLALNFIPPLALTGGYLVEQLASVRAPRAEQFSALFNRGSLIAIAVLVIALCVGGYRSLVLNFARYDDDKFAYVYAHSTRDLTKLVEDVGRIVERKGAATTVSIYSTDYWPLPWYFRDYKITGYPPLPLATANASLLILSPQQATEAQRVLDGRYRELGRYTLRPGVELALFAKQEVAL